MVNIIFIIFVLFAVHQQIPKSVAKLNEIAGEIKRLEDFFELFDGGLDEHIEKLLENVAEGTIGEVEIAIDQKLELEFLTEHSSAAFMSIKAMIGEFKDAIVEVTDQIMEAGNIKRSELELSTFFHPFEHSSHKFGFRRNVKPKGD